MFCWDYVNLKLCTFCYIICCNSIVNILYIWSLDRWSHNLVCVCFKVSFNLISSERKGKNVFTWLAFCSNRLPKPHFHFADCFSHNLLSTFGLESCRMMQDVEFFLSDLGYYFYCFQIIYNYSMPIWLERQETIWFISPDRPVAKTTQTMSFL